MSDHRGVAIVGVAFAAILVFTVWSFTRHFWTGHSEDRHSIAMHVCDAHLGTLNTEDGYLHASDGYPTPVTTVSCKDGTAWRVASDGNVTAAP